MAVEQWKVDTNKRYSEIVSTVITLATGALVVPIAVLRQIVGVKDGAPISSRLNGFVYGSWISLGFAVLLGIFYGWLSAKWIKSAHGQKTRLRVETLESWMDGLFVAMLIGFLVGIALLLFFYSSLAI